jgi:hypothetical protein
MQFVRHQVSHKEGDDKGMSKGLYQFEKDKIVSREQFLDKNLGSKDKRYVLQVENYDNDEITITILEMNVNEGTKKPLAFWHGSSEACSLIANELNEMVDQIIRARYERSVGLNKVRVQAP